MNIIQPLYPRNYDSLYTAGALVMHVGETELTTVYRKGQGYTGQQNSSNLTPPESSFKTNFLQP